MSVPSRRPGRSGTTPSLGLERPHLPDRARDGGAIDTQQPCPESVREVVAQTDECDRQPVDEDQLMPGPSAGSPLPQAASCRVTAAFNARLPRLERLLEKAGQMTPGSSRKQLMRENRPIDHDRHTAGTCPANNHTSPAITHQFVTEVGSTQQPLRGR